MDLQAFVSAAKKFENKSSTDVHSQKNAVDNCLASIEGYLLISL